MAVSTSKDRSGHAAVRLQRISETLWEIPREGAMRVPARVFADQRLIDQLRDDRSLE
jgi:tRNA-splicing ligase RtcB (3'-phosphate/5'-hydroxy nucleic acid ligase)